MATLLYQLGRCCFAAHHLVAAIWLAVIAIVTVAAVTLSGTTSASFSIGGAESQRAFDLLEQRFPELHAGGAAARLVFAAPPGRKVTDPENAEVIEQVIGVVAGGPQVGQVLHPFGKRPMEAGLISDDATMALAEITYTVDPTLLAPQVRTSINEALALGRAGGLTVEAAGTATEDTPRLGPELIGLAVSLVVLVLTFGSLVAAGLPLATGLVGVGTALAAIAALRGAIPMSDFAPLLAIMIGLAVGIDYALFILSRYRDELLCGRSGQEAAGYALGTAGTAVVFAAFTVIVALAALSFNNISLLTEMGLAAAFAVLVALAVSLTLLPALFGFAGRKVLTRRGAGPGALEPIDDSDRPALGRRWAQAIVRRPLIALLTAAIGLVLLAAPLHALNLGFIDEGSFPQESTQRRAFDLVAKGFGPGASGHLLVVVDATGAADPKVAIAEIGRALRAAEGVRDVFPPQLDRAGRTGVIVVMPAEGPASQATVGLVHEIRSEIAKMGRAMGVAVVATGSTALQIDVTALSSGALAPYLLVLVGLSLLALLVVFRSVMIPLIATGGFLLTIAATFGAMVGVYQWGWLEAIGLRPVGAFNSLLPLVIVGVAFGLAMDYQFFLATRIREAYIQTQDPHGAIVSGFSHTARVVTAAAAIMIAVFGAFGLLNDSIEIAQIGLALAVAIAIDAFVVRMTMIPALLALLGQRAWWLPGWLDRRLPDVDVEGRHLAVLLASKSGTDARRSPQLPSRT